MIKNQHNGAEKNCTANLWPRAAWNGLNQRNRQRIVRETVRNTQQVISSAMGLRQHRKSFQKIRAEHLHCQRVNNSKKVKVYFLVSRIFLPNSVGIVWG
jgi:hypothetical protein